MNILVTGATGFTGQRIVKKLVASKQHNVHIFVRDTDKAAVIFKNLSVTVHKGSFEDSKSFEAALAGCNILVNTSSLGFGHAEAVISACHKSRIKRAIFFSSTSIFTSLTPASKTVRLAAEDAIRKSGLDYTIIRPTMIFGAPGDRNMERLIRYLKKWPVMIVPGSGTFLMQPVFVNDLADAVFRIIETPAAIKKEYNLSGANATSYNDIVCTVARQLNKKVLLIHFPYKFAIPFLKLYEKTVKKPKIKAEQILRLNENKAFDHSAAVNDFGYAPKSFAEVIGPEISLLTPKNSKRHSLRRSAIR
jgi:uncharacterized protein YbjT (DUF2867 family)